MKLEDLIQKYGCVNCDATQAVIDKYNKVDERCEAAIRKALNDLEAERIRKWQLENDKIGKIRKNK